LLEELVATELEGTLEEVTGEGWASAGEKSAGTLVGDDLTEATDQAAVVGDGVELDARLDAVSNQVMSACLIPTLCRTFHHGKVFVCPHLHIDRSETSVGDGAADGTSEGEP
jgi:hypothetical protein